MAILGLSVLLPIDLCSHFPPWTALTLIRHRQWQWYVIYNNNWYVIDNNNDRGRCITNEPQRHLQCVIWTIPWLPIRATCWTITADSPYPGVKQFFSITWFYKIEFSNSIIFSISILVYLHISHIELFSSVAPRQISPDIDVVIFDYPGDDISGWYAFSSLGGYKPTKYTNKDKRWTIFRHITFLSLHIFMIHYLNEFFFWII